MTLGLQLYGCQAYSKDRIYVLAFDPRVRTEGFSNTQVLILRNLVKWQFRSVPWEAIGIAFQGYDAIVVGKYGHVLVGSATGFSQEDLTPASGRPELPGVIRNVRTIGSEVFAVGMARGVYVRTQTGAWQSRQDGLPPFDPSVPGVGFNSVSPDKDGQPVVVGWSAEVFRWNPPWVQIEVPTNVALFDITDEEGWLVACGQVGTLLRGNSEQWRPVEYEGPRLEWRKIASFAGKLFLSDGEKLFSLENGVVSPVIQGEIQLPALGFSATKDIIVTVGPDSVWVSENGTAWQSIPLP